MNSVARKKKFSTLVGLAALTATGLTGASVSAATVSVPFVTDTSWTFTGPSNPTPTGVAQYIDGQGAPGYWTNPAVNDNPFYGTGSHWISDNTLMPHGGFFGTSPSGAYFFTKEFDNIPAAAPFAPPVTLDFTFESDNVVDSITFGGQPIAFTQTGNTYQVATTISAVYNSGFPSPLYFVIGLTNLPQGGDQNPEGLLGFGTFTYTGTSSNPSPVPLPATVYGGAGLMACMLAGKMVRRMKKA